MRSTGIQTKIRAAYLIRNISRQLEIDGKGASDQFMDQHLLVKIRQLGTPHRCVANLGKTQYTRCAHGASFRLAITSDWRLDLDSPAPRHFPYAAE
jgi:hypothetical protein